MASDDEHAPLVSAARPWPTARDPGAPASLLAIESIDAVDSVDSVVSASASASASSLASSLRPNAPALAVRRVVAVHASLARTALTRETVDRLLAGGDARIAIADDGRNRYGCGTEPDAALHAFGSSTASVVSARGFDAARALTARWLIAPDRAAFEVAAMRAEILALTGADRVPGTELIVAASGTDLHLIASHLAAAGAPIGSVTVEAGETGTGVLPALAHHHFGPTTNRGERVREGEPLAPGLAARVHTVRLRQTDGNPRDIADIDADFERHVDAVIGSGARCLLSLTDLTKTGLLAPSTACAARLAERHAGRIDVLVDACQFRLAPATVRRYLEQGFMVALTGSKFVTGPAFCGALLLPPGFAERARRVRLDRLAGYTVRTDWPLDWSAADGLDGAFNIGLTTRWSAAIAELRRFRAISDVVIARDLEAFANAVSLRIATDPAFESLPSPALHRGTRSETAAGSGALSPAGSWDEIPTVFAFTVLRPNGAAPSVHLTMDETAALHAKLRNPVELPAHDDEASRVVARMRFQLGQPVACGLRQREPVSALRLCASMRTVADAAAHPDGIAPAIRQAMRAFDKMALLAGWPR